LAATKSTKRLFAAKMRALHSRMRTHNRWAQAKVTKRNSNALGFNSARLAPFCGQNCF
jgi:hypothetical protein